MPIYEYRCKGCERKVETIQGLSASAPFCCGAAMIKVPTFPAMIKWKGEGGFPSRRKEFADRKALMSRKQVPYFSPKT